MESKRPHCVVGYGNTAEESKAKALSLLKEAGADTKVEVINTHFSHGSLPKVSD